ncbi:DUF6879 family protein [Actinomadura luteofluorescens]|uniref:DUF6879 family protein n=1 Tax=Actinomadura luteofluorescens TaxID=46163 RepID=UPI003480B7DA
MSEDLHRSDRPIPGDVLDHRRRQGLKIRRVRVVERPLSPYVQWELHALRMLAEEGFELRGK